jgi:hypothetical protein
MDFIRGRAKKQKKKKKQIDVIPGILPINVQSVEIVGTKKLGRVVDELVHAEDVGGEFLERTGSDGPTADGQDDFQVRVLFSKALNSCVNVQLITFDGHVGALAELPVTGVDILFDSAITSYQRKSVILQSSECVDQMSAQLLKIQFFFQFEILYFFGGD